MLWMKLRATVCLLAFVSVTAAVAQSQPSPVTLKSRRIAGRQYVALPDVARLYGLGRDLSRQPERGRYETSFARLIVENDQRDVVLNGVRHWLSAPVIYAGGQLWMSSTDVLKVIDPVLRKGRTQSKPAIRTIVLDPGHGGADRGTHGRTGRYEKEFTLDLAKRVKRCLETNNDVRVVLTRTSDRTLSLDDRVDFAKSQHADLFVSLHFNSGGGAEGIETYCLTPGGAASTASSWSLTDDGGSQPGNRFDEQNVWLAHCVQQSLVRTARAEDRGVRRARFVVLRGASCPAILVEAGFLTNRQEEQKILTTNYRDLLAKAVADGILAYKSSLEKL
jgi:N-acetylmuramoyl-L-alanine amidase